MLRSLRNISVGVEEILDKVECYYNKAEAKYDKWTAEDLNDNGDY